MIPEDRSSLVEWTIRYFKSRFKGASIVKWSEEQVESVALIFFKFSEVFGLRSIENVARDHFVVDALIYFEQVQRFEYRSDMFSLGVPVTAWAREVCSNWRRDICFAVSLGKVSYNNIIYNVQDKISDDVFRSRVCLMRRIQFRKSETWIASRVCSCYKGFIGGREKGLRFDIFAEEGQWA